MAKVIGYFEDGDWSTREAGGPFVVVRMPMQMGVGRVEMSVPGNPVPQANIPTWAARLAGGRYIAPPRGAPFIF